MESSQAYIPQPTQPILAHIKDSRLWVAIDISTLFTAIEQRNHPGLRGKPTCITKRSQPDVIAACSDEALNEGVIPGMRVIEARRLCPTLRKKAPHTELYTRIYTKLAKDLQKISPHLDCTSLETLYINTPTLPGQLPASNFLKQIKQTIQRTTGVNCGIAYGQTKALAISALLRQTRKTKLQLSKPPIASQLIATKSPKLTSTQVLLPGSREHRPLLDWLAILSTCTSAQLKHEEIQTNELQLQIRVANAIHSANITLPTQTNQASDIYAACRKAFLTLWSGDHCTKLKITHISPHHINGQMDMFAISS